MRNIPKKKGLALFIYMVIMLIVFILFGGLIYRLHTSMLITKNNFLEVQAECIAQAAARHALCSISSVGINNFPNIEISPPSTLNFRNDLTLVPQQTYDLGAYPMQGVTNLRTNITMDQLYKNKVDSTFSYSICTWEYTPQVNRYYMRVKIFVFYRGKLIKSYIFTVEQ